ncbi:MAG: hypothetical protein EXR27_01750 [Betaproteobacteria bacterium]|nr:hypothetical protein [Betaproteobacteria bacterium]
MRRLEIFDPEDAVIPKRLGGGKLKERVIRNLDTGEVIEYALAYINPAISTVDNARVLGYDNSHRTHHRHRMGKVEPVEFTSFEELRRRFEREWIELAKRHVNGEI